MKIPPQEYIITLLELQHMGRTLAGLQMEEQRIAGILANPKTSHDINARAKLPKVREDMAQVMGIMEVQGNIVNSHMEEMYQFKFKSFKTKDYSDIQAEAEKATKEEAKTILLK